MLLWGFPGLDLGSSGGVGNILLRCSGKVVHVRKHPLVTREICLRRRVICHVMQPSVPENNSHNNSYSTAYFYYNTLQPFTTTTTTKRG